MALCLGLLLSSWSPFCLAVSKGKGGSSAGQGGAFWGSGSQLVIVQIEGVPCVPPSHSLSLLCLLVGAGFRLGSNFPD